MSKVKVISTVGHEVTVIEPQLRFKHSWNPYSFMNIERETLEELMFDPGFKRLIDAGTLYIEDMDVKKSLSLEPEEATAPVNIIILTDTDRKAMMTTMPFERFQEKMEKLSKDQIQTLADWAIANRCQDYNKCELIRKKCGRDIVQAIRLSEADKA